MLPVPPVLKKQDLSIMHCIDISTFRNGAEANMYKFTRHPQVQTETSKPSTNADYFGQKCLFLRIRCGQNSLKYYNFNNTEDEHTDSYCFYSL